jgi:hypothetical protein
MNRRTRTEFMILITLSVKECVYSPAYSMPPLARLTLAFPKSTFYVASSFETVISNM